MNLIAAEYRVAGIAAKTMRFGKPRSCLTSDLFTLQHGGKIQELQAWHAFNVTLGAMRVAYLAPQHLEAAADPDERLPSGHVRFDYRLPAVLSEPQEIRNGVLTAGQNQHIGRSPFFGPACVVDSHVGHVFQGSKIREVGKVRQSDHAHA